MKAISLIAGVSLSLCMVAASVSPIVCVAAAESREFANHEAVRTNDRWGPAEHLLSGCLVVERDSIRISLECRNWGVGGSEPMIATDSGAWTIAAEEKGKVFLRAALTGEETKRHGKRWHGELQTPSIRVDWH